MLLLFCFCFFVYYFCCFCRCLLFFFVFVVVVCCFLFLLVIFCYFLFFFVLLCSSLYFIFLYFLLFLLPHRSFLTPSRFFSCFLFLFPSCNKSSPDDFSEDIIKQQIALNIMPSTMTNPKLGFIGAGMMSSAMINGIIAAKVDRPVQLLAYLIFSNS